METQSERFSGTKGEVWEAALMEAYHSKGDWVDEKYLQPVVNDITQYLSQKQG